MKKLLTICGFILISIQLCSQQGWVPQRSKYSYRDSVSFIKDINILVPLRLQNSFKIGTTTITANGTELNILDGVVTNATELNYLVGVTSSIQNQINAKLNSNNPTPTGTVTLPSTTSIGIVSAAELAWLDGVTSSIQTQLNSKSATSHTHTSVYEPILGNPGVDGYILSSTVGGVRSWVANGSGGGSMTYPSGTGIPTVVSGSSWGTTITDNSSNWNTAYSWGNHASAGYLTSETSHADVLVDGDFTGQGIMLRGATLGTYSILGDNSANWNTAYSWGNHASAGYFVGTNSTIRGLFSSTVTGLTYTNSTGVFSLTSGYVVPTTIEQTNWGTAYSERRQWDGSSTNLVAATGRISLGLGNVTNESKATMFSSPTFTGAVVLPSTTSIGTVSSTEIGYLDGATSNIQDQLNDTTDLETVFFPKYLTINAQTTSYTFVLTDASKLITVNSSSATNLTVPLNSSVAFPIGTQILISCLGSGKSTIVATSGVTIYSKGSVLGITVLGDAELIKIGTNAWKLIGSLE
jgi:hypothetical protein